MLEKKVSIIVPAYNCENYIRQCLESIINQTYHNIEIIVVNDGSTDSTNNILHDYDGKIILINQNNLGVSTARNVGLEKATGEYIMFVDSDDWIESDMISKMIQYTDYNSIVRCQYIYEDGEKKDLMKNDEINIITKKNIYVSLIETYNFNPPYCQLIPKNIITHDYLTNISMGEDFLFNCYLYSKIEKVIVLNSQFYHYRKVSTSLVNKKDIDKIDKRAQDIVFVYGNLYDFVSEWGCRDKHYIDKIGIRIIKELNFQLLQFFQVNKIDKEDIVKYLNYHFTHLKQFPQIEKINNKAFLKEINIYTLPMLFIKTYKINLYYLYGKYIYKIIYNFAHR